MEEIMERLYSMREACSLLGVHPNTLRRWDKEGKIKVVRPGGGHRRVPESEITRLLTKSPIPQQTTSLTQQITPKVPTEPKKYAKSEKMPEKPLSGEEPPRHTILDELAPTGLTQRTAFGDLLSAATALRSFALEELSARARCPAPIAKVFCERMSGRGYLVEKDGRYELRVKVAR